MEKYIEELKPVFAQVAEKIGQSAEFGWYVVVKQQYVYGILNIVASILALVTAFLGIKMFKNGMRMSQIGSYPSDGEVWMILGGIITTIGAIVFVLTLLFGIAYLVNPEYFALQFFIDTVK